MSIIIGYAPFPGLADHPIHFQRWTVRVIKSFWGTLGFCCGARKKIRSSPSASVIGLSLMGGPPEGGSPLGGTPPRGGPPLLSKTDFIENFEKEDALSRPSAHFGPQNPVFGGVPKMTVIGRF
jgi:hypothetical protein